MSIIWKYLDKRSAAVDALKDYGSMKFIIGHTDDEIKRAYEKWKASAARSLTGCPTAIIRRLQRRGSSRVLRRLMF